MSATPAIELQHVTRRYGSHAAIDDVSLTVAEGQLVAVLGASGAGKSTLLDLIAGFAAPDAGVIRMGGRAVTRVPAHRRDVGVVFQGYALFPHLDVAGNVGFPLRARRRGSRRERAVAVADALRLVALEGVDARRPHELSGGQQQRVALARALVADPAVLLLDEPLGALDRDLRDQVREELRGLLRRAGTTTLLVTHDPAEALSLADRVLVVGGGRILQDGTPEEVHGRPRSGVVARLVAPAALLPGTVEPRGCLRLDVGPRVPLPRADLPAGSRADLVLRPEAVRLVEPDDPEALLRAVVAHRAFTGPSTRVVVALGDGSTLAVELGAGSDAVSAGDPGKAVGLSWHPHRTWAVERADPGAPPASAPPPPAGRQTPSARPTALTGDHR